MTDQSNPNSPPQADRPDQAGRHDPLATAAAPAPKRRGRLRRFALAAAVVAAAGLTGVAVGNAFGGGGFGPGMWHGPGFMGGHGFMGGRMGGFDPARMEERADRMIQHIAIELDATGEQRERLRAVVRGAVRDLAPMREKAMAARGQAGTLLTADRVDRTAIESFRAEQVALAESFSKRVSQALADAAEVLTPEQRIKVREHLASRQLGPGWRRDRMMP